MGAWCRDVETGRILKKESTDDASVLCERQIDASKAEDLRTLSIGQESRFHWEAGGQLAWSRVTASPSIDWVS